ncbi:MAG: 50S ribosomal protein L21 [Legionellaceae bacterium]|nr:50S ribosomal protein L21 [Legionellaceae bacterium]|tara:strand:- start:460 stop:765 length:306 start_codon:yes stop_codon:yes gene_type:complete
MYAVIETGGKQYRVTKGQQIKVEKLDLEPGKTVDFDKVLLVGEGESLKVGAPYAEAKVSGKVVEHGRHQKINIIKFKRRKHHMKRQGHRQHFTQVEITDIK